MAQQWTPEEDTQLRSIYIDHSKQDIQAAIDKPWMTIKRRARRLNLQRRPDLVSADWVIKGPRKDAWTPEENQLLKEIYPIGSKVDISARFGRTWRSIRAQAYSMGLRRDEDLLASEKVEGGKTSVLYQENVWSSEEDTRIKEMYELTTRAEMLKVFNRTWRAIKQRANKLGVTRNPELVKKENVEYTVRAPKV